MPLPQVILLWAWQNISRFGPFQIDYSAGLNQFLNIIWKKNEKKEREKKGEKVRKRKKKKTRKKRMHIKLKKK